MIHRDIKPSNIVIEDPDNLETVKLVDFGLSLHCMTCVPHLEEFAGTVIYMAPEQILKQTYAKSVDIWAIGIIMYELLTGRHPFWQKGMDKPKLKEIIQNYKDGQEWDFPEEFFSPYAKNMCQTLCSFNPSGRYNPYNAANHPWITRDFNQPIPRTMFEENVFLVNLDQKLHKAFGVSLFAAIVKNHDQVERDF